MAEVDADFWLRRTYFNSRLVRLEFVVVKLTQKQGFICLCRQLTVACFFWSIQYCPLRFTPSILHTPLHLIYWLIINFEKNIYFRFAYFLSYIYKFHSVFMSLCSLSWVRIQNIIPIHASNT